METIKNVKKQVESYEIKYIPHDDPLDPRLKPMISHDGYVKYSASCNENIIKVFCKKEDIKLIRTKLENVIKEKIATKLWLSMLKEAKA